MRFSIGSNGCFEYSVIRLKYKTTVYRGLTTEKAHFIYYFPLFTTFFIVLSYY